MSQVTQKGPVKPQMNMTPLIDVVFLLIIFFMLVNKIVSEEAVPMIVPRIDNSKAIELGEIERIVVSVAYKNSNNDKRLEKGGDAYLKTPSAPNNEIIIKVGQKTFTVDNLLPAGGGSDFGPDDESAAGILSRRVEAAGKDEKGQPKLEVLLRADAAMPYAEVERVMAVITAAKVGKVNLVTYLPKDQ